MDSQDSLIYVFFSLSSIFVSYIDCFCLNQSMILRCYVPCSLEISHRIVAIMECMTGLMIQW